MRLEISVRGETSGVRPAVFDLRNRRCVLALQQFLFLLPFHGGWALFEMWRRPQRRHWMVVVPIVSMGLALTAWYPVLEAQQDFMALSSPFFEGRVGLLETFSMLARIPLRLVARRQPMVEAGLRVPDHAEIGPGARCQRGDDGLTSGAQCGLRPAGFLLPSPCTWRPTSSWGITRLP